MPRYRGALCEEVESGNEETITHLINERVISWEALSDVDGTALFPYPMVEVSFGSPDHCPTGIEQRYGATRLPNILPRVTAPRL